MENENEIDNIKIGEWIIDLMTKDKGMYLEMAKVCEEIAKKDGTFQPKILRHGFTFHRIYTIRIRGSESKDQAEKRGMWFRHKLGEAVFYKVREI